MSEGTLAKVIEIERLRAGGMEMKEACIKAGLSSPTYYKWKNGTTGNFLTRGKSTSEEAVRKRKYRKRLKFKVTELEDKHAATQKVFMFYGDPNGIAETIRRLEG